MATTRQDEKARRPGVAPQHEASGLRDRRGKKPGGGGVPRRALADGVVERRRATRRTEQAAPAAPTEPSLSARPGVAAEDRPPALLTAEEHYRLERRRRADRLTGDLMALLAEAKAEYEAHINAPRPAGKGGRPRKKVATTVVDDDDEE